MSEDVHSCRSGRTDLIERLVAKAKEWERLCFRVHLGSSEMSEEAYRELSADLGNFVIQETIKGRLFQLKAILDDITVTDQLRALIEQEIDELAGV